MKHLKITAKKYVLGKVEETATPGDEAMFMNGHINKFGAYIVQETQRAEDRAIAKVNVISAGQRAKERARISQALEAGKWKAQVPKPKDKVTVAVETILTAINQNKEAKPGSKTPTTVTLPTKDKDTIITPPKPRKIILE